MIRSMTYLGAKMKLYRSPGGPGMFVDIVERLLGDAVECGLDILRERRAAHRRCCDLHFGTDEQTIGQVAQAFIQAAISLFVWPHSRSNARISASAFCASCRTFRCSGAPRRGGSARPQAAFRRSG